MPQTVQQPTENVPAPHPLAFTRAHCERFVADGHLEPGKFELIEGFIARKMGPKRLHSAGVGLLFAWCILVFGERFVQSQATIDVSPEDTPTSEPEPDVFVLARSIDEFPEEFPGSADLVLVAEISDTTLAFDLTTKASLYARAKIVEYWVVDVSGRNITIHREPLDGRYTKVIRYAADETVATLARPTERIVASKILLPVVQDI